MNKTDVQIKSTLQNHKIVCGRAHKDRLVDRQYLFTDEQIQFIRENYKDRSAAEMTVLFNSTFDTDMTLQQIKTAVHNRRINSGRTGHFEKGHKPWNTDTKGVCQPNSGSFKNGSVPANIKPLGHERVCSKDGFVLIKVAEKNPYTGASTRYKHKHVHMWEQEHGPVPDGFAVMFIDSDKLNIEPGNLMLVSRAELFRLNKHGYKNAPAELKPSILALVKVEVKMFKKINERRWGNENGNPQ
ncbi:HNH endonuclease [Candidatus Pacearchaeota archaeon]|nr:HNH endonuclease [Candidatus Pacearchaeota archaeon]